MQHVHDAIIVGSGCAGGWVAKELTEAGLQVLVLEAGPELDSSSLGPGTWTRGAPPDTGDGWQPRASQPVQAQHGSYRQETAALFVNDEEAPYSTPAGRPFHWIRGRQVGGRSLTWGRLCLRLSNLEMAAGSADGLSDCWPITYEDLAPHYSAVEAFLAVRGSVEGLPQLPDGEYLPPAPLTAGEEWLRERVAVLWPERKIIPARGVDYAEANGTWPRFTSPGSTLAAARATRRLQLQPDAVVRQVFVLANKSRAEGVHWIDRTTGSEHEARARVVVLCASTIETARILLNSATRGHKLGLGNSSDVLGRFLMDHPFASIGGTGAFPRNLDSLPFEGPHGFIIPRFRNLTGGPGAGYARGYGIWGGLDRGGFRGGRFMLMAYGEMLPRPENRVTLAHRCDRWGMPLAHIDCEWTANERALMRDAFECLHQLAERTGLKIARAMPMSEPGQFVHEVGTARMGTSATKSYLNADCQCWEIDNLFVADGAAWTTSGYQNPTLTTMALARRCAHAILSRLGVRSGTAASQGLAPLPTSQ